MYVSQQTLLYPGAAGEQSPVTTPPPWGERIEIATSDGERLEALLSPAAEGQPTALFFHGNASRIDDFGFLAGLLAERGYGLLALSYRGYGGSTGSPSEAGLIADGLAAFDMLVKRRDGPVVVVGQSLGSAVAVAVAAERPAVGLVLISAPDSIAAVAQHHYPYLPVAALIRDPFRSDLRIADVDAPKLFLHGDRDTLIPVERGRALFERAPEPREFRELPGYGHNDLWTVEMVEIITDFVEASAKASAE